LWLYRARAGIPPAQPHGPGCDVFDAPAIFADLVHAGKVLDGIILTNGGKPTGAPLGIVTVAAVPRLNRLVTA
jgi:hypothetical protein